MAFRIGWQERTRLIDAFPVNVLLEWSAADDERARRLAMLTRPSAPLAELPRRLIATYGYKSEVSRQLANNFASGIWSGTYTDRLRQQLSIAMQWIDDETQR